ncbi:MAG: helicase-related protein, partial [Candidatus Kapaibacterium sp.]
IETMEHRLYEAPTLDKDQILIRLIEMERPDSAIIFCNMKSDVEYVANVLKGRGYNAEMISGDLKQNQREQVMQGIRDNRYRFLVATDVAARGIDISDLSHVFLYDIPMDPELYVHRAGRTARAGNTGVAISLVGNMSDRTTLKRIGRKYGIEFVEMPTPTEDQVAERIGERLTIHLEERWRSLTAALQTSVGRFELVVKSLSETEEKQSLLAMLLADLYQETFNASQNGPEKSGGKSRTSGEKKSEKEKSSPAEEVEQIAEGLIAYLENRWRSLTPGVRKRMVRFESVVKALTESEEERLLLAMLLADLYQEMQNTPQKENVQNVRNDKSAETSRKASVKNKKSDTPQESSSSEQNPPRKKKRRRRPNKSGTSSK